MKKQELNLQKHLQKHFGFNQFKGLQEPIIKSLLNQEDSFVIMPTGGGKSMCYQLPALILEGTAIVVSPLIALMKNQVDAIRGISEEEGIAHVLNSSLNKKQIEKVKSDIQNGITKLLYVAPESLTKEENILFFKSVNISFFAIDEAHCISEWGHDFRPEYRNLRNLISEIGRMPIIALTATATPKVQEDIQKNLGMSNSKVFKASFNRDNLFYEIRPKVNIQKELVKFVKQRIGKSGVIYCLSRKKVEETAQLLQVNGINALPYHAGLDAKTRVKHQDDFLMEQTDVIVATIAFGMGIDKPDVRFVIHHDMPKSLESYYQETGRAGRDGGEGHCLAFYDYKDIEKLEKFLAGKPVAEREIGEQLLQDVVSYAETAMNRRKFILHYFGEEFDEINGEGANMCDNSRNPKKQFDVQQDLVTVLEVILKSHQKLKAKDLIKVITGKNNAIINSNKFDTEPYFGIGKEKEEKHWMAVIRQAIVRSFIQKEIESYGVLKSTDLAKKFIENPHEFLISEDHNYDNIVNDVASPQQSAASFDKVLLANLKALRKKVALKHGIPPFAIFQDGSLEDMSFIYPCSIEDMTKVFGVGEGKARKFGKDFIKLIQDYVEVNNISRPDDLVIKSIVNKSSHKVYIIQNTDRKLDLEDIAKAKSMSLDDLISEMESIIYQGTKLNIDYYLNDIFDEDQLEEVHDYFMEAESDKISDAVEEFDHEYSEEEIRLIRIKFLSDVAN